MQDWQTWFKNLIAKNYFFTKLTNPDEVSSPIVKAIKEKEVTPQIDPSDISQPIVGAIDDLRKSVEEKEGIEEVTVKNIEQAKADLTEVVSVLKDILNKEEKDIEFPEQKETVIDLAPVIKALGKIEKAIPDYKPEQVADYTEILQNLTKVIESKQPVDLSKIESQLSTAFSPLAKTEDMVAIAAWLEAIAKKPHEETPPFEFEKGRLKVQVDRTSGGGGSVLTSVESEKLLGISTEAKQDDIIAALGGGVRIKKIDEALPYTYIGEAAVGTLTSAASWRIKRVDDTSDPDSTILYAGTGAFDQIWDNRVGLTYN